MPDSKKITVAFFLPSLEGGGAERNVVNILRHIDKDRYAVTLLLARKSGVFLNQLQGDTPVVDLGGASAVNVFFKVAMYLYRQKPNLFISTFPRFNFINLLAKILVASPTRFVIVEHTTPSRLHLTTKTWSHKLIAYFFLPTLLRFFYPKASAIICVSQGVKDDLCVFIGNSPKISVIYNPVIHAGMKELASQPAPHRWLIEKKNPVVIAVGRLMSTKGYSVLLHSFAHVIEKIPSQLIILGEGQDRASLELLASQLGIRPQVDFVGFVENPYQYLSRADVFVNSSIREGFANAIVEAMACGLPVVATQCVGPQEIMEHAKNGLLVPVGDSQKMTEAIVQILEDSVLAKRLAQEGRRRSEFFSIDKSVRGYEHIFQSVSRTS